MSGKPSVEFGADFADWPLLRVCWPQRADLEFVDHVTDALAQALARGTQFCLLVDFRHTKRMEIAEIKRLTAFVEHRGDELDEQLAAKAHIVPSAMVRGALKVLFALRPPGSPYQVARTPEAAHAYLAPYINGLMGKTAT